MNFISQFKQRYLVAENAILFLWGGAIILIIISFLCAYYKIRSGPENITLHYNVIVGVDVLGSKTKLYQIPVTAVVIVLINAALIRILRLPRYLSVLLAAVGFACSIILLLAILFLFGVE